MRRHVVCHLKRRLERNVGVEGYQDATQPCKYCKGRQVVVKRNDKRRGTYVTCVECLSYYFEADSL